MTYPAVDETSPGDRILGHHLVCDDVEIFVLVGKQIEEERGVSEGREVEQLSPSVVHGLVGAPNDDP